ncbi:nuclear transport factor 2 family protein [Spirillospora sp. NPDC048911]|uniref:nuclear transport factor 2 family protein n=1 Tax=Spirillospora sp. NPDC048911 TaxID=3364527 RepID=UPI0037146523
MPMSPVELSDRFEIGEVLARYALAVDSGRWELLDTVFTEDATLDYSSAGGITGSLAEAKDWLAKMLPSWPGRQHLIGPPLIAFDDDRAEVTAPFSDTLAPSRDTIRADTKGLVQGGGWYHHRMVRTAGGWRSRALVLEQLWRTMQ